MWWILKNSSLEGPLTAEQVQKRVALNMLGSLDRISEDKKNWRYVRDSIFWNPRRTVRSKPLEIPQVAQNASQTAAPSCPQPQSVSPVPAAPTIPNRLKIETAPSKELPKKGIWIALVSVLAVAVVAFVVVVSVVIKARPITPPILPATSPSIVDFKTIKDKLVIIESAEGNGSGFVIEMGGKVYLMSNEHVLRTSSTPQARFLNGKPLILGAFSVAEGRDLARFEVFECPVEPLRACEEMPNIGDFVVLYGNSLGGGVATESKGYIQGVGDRELETNVDIVPGNSGSPLLSDEGKVVGVAASIKYNGDGREDWTIRNTRYDGKARRFAVRLSAVRWKTIDRKSYEDQVAKMNELGVFCEFLVPFLDVDNRVPQMNEKILFKDLHGKYFKIRGLGFDKMLADLSKSYEKKIKIHNKWGNSVKERAVYLRRLIAEGISEENYKKVVAEYDDETARLFEKLKESWRNFIMMRKSALLLARTFLVETQWDSPNMKNGYGSGDDRGSVKRYLDTISVIIDEIDQDMKDFNKLITEIEQGDDYE